MRFVLIDDRAKESALYFAQPRERARARARARASEAKRLVLSRDCEKRLGDHPRFRVYVLIRLRLLSQEMGVGAVQVVGARRRVGAEALGEGRGGGVRGLHLRPLQRLRNGALKIPHFCADLARETRRSFVETRKGWRPRERPFRNARLHKLDAEGEKERA